MTDFQVEEENEIKRYRESPQSFRLGDFVSHRYVAFALKKRGLEKESKRVFLAATRGYLLSMGYKLGNSSPSDVGKLYEQAGKRLHAAKYYLLSTHQLGYEDRERLSLTDRELDYAKRSAQKTVRNNNNGLYHLFRYEKHPCFLEETRIESLLNSVEENVRILNENRAAYLKEEVQ